MTNQDEQALTNEVPDIDPRTKATGHKGLRVASVAGIAIGLTVGAGAAASAATSGSTTTPRATTTGSTSQAPSGMHGAPAAFGTVKSVGVDSFIVTTHDGKTITVDVSTSTTYRDRAMTSSSFADVKVGEHVAAFGTERAGTVTATSVGFGRAGGQWGGRGARPAAIGTVKSVGVDSFIVTTHDGKTITVDVSTSTTYRDRDVTSPTLANIKVGENVAVFGAETSDIVTATSVGIRRPGGRGIGWSGNSMAGP
jgi:hypothetical protein